MEEHDTSASSYVYARMGTRKLESRKMERDGQSGKGYEREIAKG
jgi:hypothetical protein